MQRKAILLDPNWNNGCYDDTNYPVDGMKTARKLGIITYRSANEWTDRFGRLHIRDQDRAKSGPFGIEFEVERYLEKQALRFARSYDPNCYLYMSQSIDWFDLGDCMTGNVELEFQNMSLDSALVIGVHSDILFPLHQQQRIADSLRERGVPTSFHALESSQGHDAFLVDIDRFGPVVRKYMEELTGGLSMHRRHVKPAERIGQLDAQAPQTSMGDRRSLRSKVPLPSNTTV